MTKDKNQHDGGGRYLYRSETEATQKTGHFSLYSIKVTRELGELIASYLSRSGLVTHHGVNQRHTSRNTYTARFCLKQYSIFDESTGKYRQYAYLDGRGRWGHRYRYGDPYEAKYVADAPVGERYQLVPSDIVPKNMQDLWERTPSLRQMYFWICQKYPAEILWVDCTHQRQASSRFGQAADTDAAQNL